MIFFMNLEGVMMNSDSSRNTKQNHRYALLDSIRGITLLSMIFYHGAWDLVYLYHVKWDWYKGTGAYIWQQSICWTFIFLSGFCWSLGKKPLKRGLLVFGGGLLVSAVTCLLMPENRVVFGVLTLTGSCMLLMIPLDKVLKKIPAKAGIFLSLLLFVITRNVNAGQLGFEGLQMAELPESLYHGLATTYLGFMEPGFFSTDYFSLFPWLFLFISGYYLYHIFAAKDVLSLPVFKWGLQPFCFLGRHSLIIYLLHQPVLYLAGLCFFG